MAAATDALAQALKILGMTEQAREQRLGEKNAPIEAVVSRQFKKSGDKSWADAAPPEVKEEKFTVHRFVTAPANVGVDLGLTINTGNFESARISVSVLVPCYREEIDDAYRWAKEWVEERVKVEVAEIQGLKKSNSPF
jgi:hypothetical protein